MMHRSKKRTLFTSHQVETDDDSDRVEIDANYQKFHRRDSTLDTHRTYHRHQQIYSDRSTTPRPAPTTFRPHTIIVVVLLLFLHCSSVILSFRPQRVMNYHEQDSIVVALSREACMTTWQQQRKNLVGQRIMLAPTTTPISITPITNTIRVTTDASIDEENNLTVHYPTGSTTKETQSSDHVVLLPMSDEINLLSTDLLHNGNTIQVLPEVVVTPYYASIRDNSLLLALNNARTISQLDIDTVCQPLLEEVIINGISLQPNTTTNSCELGNDTATSLSKRFLPLTGLRNLWRRIRGGRRSGTKTLTTPTITLRSIWRHRHARSAEEGIRREFATQALREQSATNEVVSDVASSVTANLGDMDAGSGDTFGGMKTRNRRTARQLSSIFAKANASIERTSRRVAARTLTGLITAMAEEVQDLNVEVDARDETPYRNKHITAVRIQFSRLGFKPLRLGGHNSPTDLRQQQDAVTNHHFLLMNQFRFNQKSTPKSSFNKRVGVLSGRDATDENDEIFLDHIDADEAFDRIDVDKSGFLDRKELIQALGLAAIVSNDKTLVLDDMESDSHVSILEELASDLFELYDVNGDGVVDRKEYKMMVADMAALRNRDQKRRRETESVIEEDENHEQHNWFFSSIGSMQNRTSSTIAASVEYFQHKMGFFTPSMEYMQNKSGLLSSGVSSSFEFLQNKTGLLTTGVSAGVGYGVEYVQNTTGYITSTSIDFLQNNTGFTEYVQNSSELLTNSMEFVKGKLPWPTEQVIASLANSTNQVVDSVDAVESLSKSLGSITFSDVKMDLRRLFFGGIPILKHLVPGGPLILEPFTTTITGSFNRNDILNSHLLDAGLRRLVMRALRRRVGFLRDALEGAMFKGRSWKTFGDETGGGPQVEIPELTNVEFDENDKLIITGRARVQTSPDAAVINQSFKVRTSIGTRKDGRFIRLEEPELALVLECPESWEKK